jgi:hypothetical protein
MAPAADGIPNILPPAAVQGGGRAPQVQPVAQMNAPPGMTLPPEQKPRTFREFYNDTRKDPCRGDYSGVMQRFDPEAATVVASEILLEQALGCRADMHQAYLCCAPTRRGNRIFCVHLPSHFASSLDGRTTPWDNNMYACLGDVTNDIATTICLPITAFTPIANVLAFTKAHLVANIQGENGQDVFPPQHAINDHTTAVTTRPLMYLPSRYVHLFLDARGYTIRHLWETLPPLLEQNQDSVACQPLLKWLRVASHGTRIQNAQGQPILGPPAVAIHLVSPVADSDLILHRDAQLKQALPGLGHTPANLETALLQMAQAVATQTNDNRLARETKAAESLLPTLPSSKFKNTLPILMDYLQVVDETDLPLLWHQWANSNKRQEFSVLRELLDTFSRSPQAFYNLSPVVSAKLVQDLLSFTFLGESQDDLKSGIQPFIIADGSEEYRRANLDLAQTYGLLHDSAHGITYADLQALESKEVQSIPLTYFELEKCLGMFGNLLGVVLGSDHALSRAYRPFWDLLTRGLRNDLQIVIDTTGRIKPAHVLRSIQLVCYSWFNHRKARLQPSPPDFLDILHRITLQSYVLPHLPPALFRLVYPAAHLLHTASVTPSAATASMAPSAITSSMSASLTDMSTITTPSITPSRVTTTRGTFQANLTPDSMLQSLVPANYKLKDLIGTDTPPLMDDGTPICLSFHLRQGCWSTCKRAATHAKQLSNAEKQKLANFALAQLAKRGSTGPQTVPP